MTWLWVVTGAALLVAVASWLTARRAARRAAQLSELYWELKYQQAELRNAVLGSGSRNAPAVDTPATPPQPAPRPPADSFIPLKSLRR
jgi:hypothetical protein